MKTIIKSIVFSLILTACASNKPMKEVLYISNCDQLCACQVIYRDGSWAREIRPEKCHK